MQAPPVRGSSRLLSLLAGLSSLVIGTTLSFAPALLRAHSGIVTDPSASSLSETRAPGGALIAIGALLLVGLGRATWHRPALVAAAVTFLGYAGGRGVSIVIDGLPSGDLLAAALAELVFGAWALFELARSREAPAGTEPAFAQATIS